MLVAIDNLGRINRSYGFDVADQVIAAVAKRVRSRMRGKDTLGRFSGNKFGLVLRDCTPDDMAIAAERMLASLRDDMVPTSAGADCRQPLPSAASTAPRHARGMTEVLARAQETLDSAKARRRELYLAYQPNIEREALRRGNVRATDEIVRRAQRRRRIFLAYETIVAATDRKLGVLRMLDAHPPHGRQPDRGKRHRAGCRAAWAGAIARPSMCSSLWSMK